jgi:hypothetical protein
MDRTTIDAYFEHRGYKNPDSTEAFLFLLSEMGELAEVFLAFEYGPTVVRNDCKIREVILQMRKLGMIADDLASGRGGWVRNNGRKGPLDLPGEIGDVLMMLDRVAKALGTPEPGDCLKFKMQVKGFDFEEMPY